MKIVYLVHQFFPEYQSGTEKFVLNNALMAQKSGNKVKVITYSFLDDETFEKENNGILFREYVYKGIPILAFKYKEQPIDIHIALENHLLRQYAKEIITAEAPDIIHVGHSMRVHEFVRAAIEMNIPYLITLTDFFLICPKVILAPTPNSLCSGPQGGKACKILCSEFNENFIGARLKTGEEFLAHARTVASPSEFVSKIFKQEFPYLHLQIIGHGINYKHIHQNSRIYKHDDELVFAFAGTLAPHKGVHILVKAFTLLEAKNIKLVIYGSGEAGYTTALREIAGKDERITFMGTYSSEEVGEIFNRVDMLIIPSICYENYPLVIHEALVSNIPIIASNLGGMSEKVKDGINGFTFEPGSSEDLARKMKLIIDDPLILNELKENIKKFMVVPTIEQEAYKYFKIYSSLNDNLSGQPKLS